jgi:hypothetical protein
MTCLCSTCEIERREVALFASTPSNIAPAPKLGAHESLPVGAGTLVRQASGPAFDVTGEGTNLLHNGGE